MSPKRIKRFKAKESKLIRVLGAAVGVLILIAVPYLYLQAQLPIGVALGGLFFSILFIAYGVGGSELFFRVMPTTSISKRVPFLDYSVDYSEDK